MTKKNGDHSFALTAAKWLALGNDGGVGDIEIMMMIDCCITLLLSYVLLCVTDV